MYSLLTRLLLAPSIIDGGDIVIYHDVRYVSAYIKYIDIYIYIYIIRFSFTPGFCIQNPQAIESLLKLNRIKTITFTFKASPNKLYK